MLFRTSDEIDIIIITSLSISEKIYLDENDQVSGLISCRYFKFLLLGLFFKVKL